MSSHAELPAASSANSALTPRTDYIQHLTVLMATLCPCFVNVALCMCLSTFLHSEQLHSMSCRVSCTLQCIRSYRFLHGCHAGQSSAGQEHACDAACQMPVRDFDQYDITGFNAYMCPGFEGVYCTPQDIGQVGTLCFGGILCCSLTTEGVHLLTFAGSSGPCVSSSTECSNGLICVPQSNNQSRCVSYVQ